MSGNIQHAILSIYMVVALSACASFSKPKPLVLTTDFGTRDGAVSAMKGVAAAVDSRIPVSDLSHEIQTYNIWEGAYRLKQTYSYWPAGTVFVSVIDPGVGSNRRSLVGLTQSGHYFVGPDNGLFTLVGDESGWKEVRVIKESEYRRKGSADSYTFHGRDVYAYVGALLAAGQLNFKGLGQVVAASELVRLPYQKAEVKGKAIFGNIPVLDPNYGNVWTNIPRGLVLSQNPKVRKYSVKIAHKGRVVYTGVLPLVDTFAGVARGTPLLYFNSLLNLSVALNQANFANTHRVGSGPDWTIELLPR